MTEPSTACELCGRELHAEARAYLCPGCTRATLERLDRMAPLYVALAAFLQPTARRPEFGSARPVEAPLPASEPVLNLRGPGGMVGVLEDWRSAMQADRGWGQPAISGDTGKRVATAARGLALNLEWIASSWPAAGTFAAEIRSLEGDVLSVIGPPEDRGTRMGNCPAAYDGVICGAVLRLPPGGAVATCRWCGASYPPASWARLRLAQDGLEAAS